MTRGKFVLPFPGVVRIEPASQCNLHCSHCPTGTFDMATGVMDWDVFSRVLPEIESNKDTIRIVVLYHGGEPLLNKRFFQMVRAIKACGLPVKTVSNGMALTERAARSAVESRLDSIEISLDGEDAEENSAVRIGCDYKKVVANVKRLIRLKAEMSSSTPEVFIATTGFLREKGGTVPRSAPIPAYLVREFSGEYRPAIAGIKPSLAMRWPHMGSIESEYDTYVDPADTEVENYCDHIRQTITIRWNGDVVPCCYDLTSRLVMGNIMSDRLADIWNSAQYLSLRQGIHDRKFAPLCNNCNVVKPSVYLIRKRRMDVAS